MISRIVQFGLNNRFVVVLLTLGLIAWGLYSFHRLPVEAYPDVADTWVQVITQWPGHAAEEVEQQVTIPIETQMNGMAHLTHLRSTSLYGLSVVTLIFDDSAQTLQVRQQALERLAAASVPPNVNPQLGPNYSPVGQIYWYVMHSTNPAYGPMELKSLQDWTVARALKTVPGVEDDSIFGGTTKEYQVLVDPAQLVSYNLTLAQVEQALTNNNTNLGGGFIERGDQQVNIRGIGLVTDTADIGNIVITQQNGVPVRVADVAQVVIGPKVRLGRIGRTVRVNGTHLVDDNDVVEGVVLLRKGEQAEDVLPLLHEKVKELNHGGLPPGVTIVPFLDRTDLLLLTTHTVLHNLVEGMILVSLILLFFLGNLRAALIVALTIPFSLLFAAILLGQRHIPANLLSLGALDFGMVVDGAVVMVENIHRHLGERSERRLSVVEAIMVAAREVESPIFYSIAIIIAAYFPIFTLQRVEGKLFAPMAWTVTFALAGALTFSLLIAPALCEFLSREEHEWQNPLLVWLLPRYRRALRFCFDHPGWVWGPVVGLLLITGYLMLSGVIGSEFLPHLDEGAIWARGTLPASTGPQLGGAVAQRARLIFASFPEVPQVVSQDGRPDDGTDVTGFYNTEYYLELLPRSQWRPRFHNKEELIKALNRAVTAAYPTVIWNFSQPISDNVEEATSGVKGALAVKIIGDDLHVLDGLATQVASAMAGVRGVADLGVFRELGQPNLNIRIDRAAAARFGLGVSDLQDALQTAIGGHAVSQVLIGDQRYDLVVRYPPTDRASIAAIGDVQMVTPTAQRVAIKEVARISEQEGGSLIYREGNQRYIAVKFSVRDRDLGSAVREAQAAVARRLKLPPGYHLDWTGEYESQQRSQARLATIVPLTIFFIFVILYSAFKSGRWAMLVMTTILLAPIGGTLALLVSGTHFSVSSGVGFLALFGVSVQTGVIMVSYMEHMRKAGASAADAAIEGATLRLRPILMTALVATLGLVPAAFSHGIGSDSQRPFAIVIVGGLSVDLVLSLFVLPTLYARLARKLAGPEPLPVGGA
ncbi:MAG: efflux RND transporter permease subunit [Terriglobales bacterium]